MPRDDGAPTLDELTRAVQWAADHAVYASDDARRPDVLTWLVSHLSSLVAAQGQGLRDDVAPTVVALRIALADAQTAFSGEDDRRAALVWLAAHLSSLIADSTKRLEFFLEGDIYVTDSWGQSVVLRSNRWVDDDILGRGATPREAIDNAIERENENEATQR